MPCRLTGLWGACVRSDSTTGFMVFVCAVVLADDSCSKCPERLRGLLVTVVRVSQMCMELVPGQERWAGYLLTRWNRGQDCFWGGGL